MADVAGVYLIEGPRGRQYVGSSVRIKKRWKEHRRQLESGCHHNQFLQRAWTKYGPGSFGFRVLLVCDSELAVFYEQRAIDALNPEYNCAPFAGSMLGYRHSDESRKKMSASSSSRLKGSNFKGHSHSAETKRRISERKSGVARGPHSLETREKIGAAHRGKVISPMQRERISKSLSGRKQDPLLVEKRAAARRGGKMPPGFAEKARARMIGQRHSRQVLQKISRSKSLLGDDQVRDIRIALASGATQASIARSYSIDQSTVSDIKRGKTYGWVAE